MKITIGKPLGYSQIGRKDQQEDAVWPLFSDVTTSNLCFVLCDGVGGSKHGEVASQTSSKVIGEYLTKIINEKQIVTEADVNEAVNLAYDELEKLDNEDAEEGVVSMATTLTCVCLHSDGILAAHMGDSRIYHVRPREGLKYQSNDHSLVNALLAAGELKPEEVGDFPRKNVIIKAIQPHGKKRFSAEVRQLTDVNKGDYLFLCCDGVLEQLTNDRLIEILSMSCSNEQKIQLLEAESTDKTKDNYTAYLIPIVNVEGESSLVDEEEVSAEVVDVDVVEEHAVSKQTVVETPVQRDPITSQNESKKKSILFLILIAILAITSVFLLKTLFFGEKDSSEPSNDEIENVDTLKNNSMDSLISTIKNNPQK